MHHLTLADAILLVVLTLVAPSYSYYAGIRIARGTMPSRTFAYTRTMLSWWLIAAAMLFVWLRLERPIAALGLAIHPDARLWIGAAFCALLLAYMNGQWRVVRRMPPEKLAALRRSFGRTSAVLPATATEYRLFLALSVTAGVCEELLFRGYFFAIASPFLTLMGAIVASALIFGLGHAYQGSRGVVKTTLAGVFFGLVYAATGSLLWPMILHTLVDVQGGTIGYRLLRDVSSARSTDTS